MKVIMKKIYSYNTRYLGLPMPADGSGTDLKHGGSSLPDLTNFKIEPNPSANNFVHMSGGTCSTIKVEEPDQGSPYSSVRNSYNYYICLHHFWIMHSTTYS